MTLEQAKRLKAAGFEMKRCPYYHSPTGECGGLQVKCPEPTDDDCWFLIGEKEMMEFLAKNLIAVCPLSDCDGWIVSIFINGTTVVSRNIDLTEALVQACCRVLEGRGK